MTIENNKTTFSVRLPTEMVRQIDARRKLHKRSRNAEIEVLLEEVIDLHVARDKKLIERHTMTENPT